MDVIRPAVQVTYFQLGASHGHVLSFQDAWMSSGHLHVPLVQQRR